MKKRKKPPKKEKVEENRNEKRFEAGDTAAFAQPPALQPDTISISATGFALAPARSRCSHNKRTERDISTRLSCQSYGLATFSQTPFEVRENALKKLSQICPANHSCKLQHQNGLHKLLFSGNQLPEINPRFSAHVLIDRIGRELRQHNSSKRRLCSSMIRSRSSICSRVSPLYCTFTIT